jgi:hypothetical protein
MLQPATGFHVASVHSIRVSAMPLPLFDQIYKNELTPTRVSEVSKEAVSANKISSKEVAFIEKIMREGEAETIL